MTLIQAGEEYETPLQNVKLKLQSALTVAEKVNFTDNPYLVNKGHC
jgi:hypothetical protein